MDLLHDSSHHKQDAIFSKLLRTRSRDSPISPNNPREHAAPAAAALSTLSDKKQYQYSSSIKPKSSKRLMKSSKQDRDKKPRWGGELLDATPPARSSRSDRRRGGAGKGHTGGGTGVRGNRSASKRGAGGHGNNAALATSERRRVTSQRERDREMNRREVGQSGYTSNTVALTPRERIQLEREKTDIQWDSARHGRSRDRDHFEQDRDTLARIERLEKREAELEAQSLHNIMAAQELTKSREQTQINPDLYHDLTPIFNFTPTKTTSSTKPSRASIGVHVDHQTPSVKEEERQTQEHYDIPPQVVASQFDLRPSTGEQEAARASAEPAPSQSHSHSQPQAHVVQRESVSVAPISTPNTHSVNVKKASRAMGKVSSPFLTADQQQVTHSSLSPAPSGTSHESSGANVSSSSAAAAKHVNNTSKSNVSYVQEITPTPDHSIKADLHEAEEGHVTERLVHVDEHGPKHSEVSIEGEHIYDPHEDDSLTEPLSDSSDPEEAVEPHGAGPDDDTDDLDKINRAFNTLHEDDDDDESVIDQFNHDDYETF